MADETPQADREVTVGPPDPDQSRVYPKTDVYHFQEFAGPVFEFGGYSDITMIDPWSGRRLWISDGAAEGSIYDQLRAAIDEAEKVGFLGLDGKPKPLRGPVRVIQHDGSQLYPRDAPFGRVTATAVDPPDYGHGPETHDWQGSPQVWVKLEPSFRPGVEYDLDAYPADRVQPLDPEASD